MANKHYAIICRRHESDLITIWSRPTQEEAERDFELAGKIWGDKYLFALVRL